MTNTRLCRLDGEADARTPIMAFAIWLAAAGSISSGEKSDDKSYLMCVCSAFYGFGLWVCLNGEKTEFLDRLSYR